MRRHDDEACPGIGGALEDVLGDMRGDPCGSLDSDTLGAEAITHLLQLALSRISGGLELLLARLERVLYPYELDVGHGMDDTYKDASCFIQAAELQRRSQCSLALGRPVHTRYVLPRERSLKSEC